MRRMTLIDPQEYRAAFVQYLRKGTPIRLETKNTQPTTHYVWRTRRDGKVRSSHAEREGQVFSWDDPPEGGHPGADYGCRCTAEPYLPQISEFMEIFLQGVSGGGAAWSSRDFVNHYYRGNGRGVTVRETGHLSAIVDEYMAQVEKRLKDQISGEAREKRDGSFSDTFYNTYGMTGVVFSIGDTEIGGKFSGTVEEQYGVLALEASFEFYLRDEFADPLDIGLEVGGNPYPITDEWSGTLSGQIYLDPARSDYG